MLTSSEKLSSPSKTTCVNSTKNNQQPWIQTSPKPANSRISMFLQSYAVCVCVQKQSWWCTCIKPHRTSIHVESNKYLEEMPEKNTVTWKFSHYIYKYVKNLWIYVQIYINIYNPSANSPSSLVVPDSLRLSWFMTYHMGSWTGNDQIPSGWRMDRSKKIPPPIKTRVNWVYWLSGVP